MTTIAGLYRYEMNDIVEVVDRYHDSPVIAFVRKAGEMSNLTGEKLHANHVIEALDVLRSEGVPFVQAQLAADVDHMRYALSLEFLPGHLADTAELAHTVDEALMRLNIEYAEKRRSRRLEPVVINVKLPGWATRRAADGYRSAARTLRSSGDTSSVQMTRSAHDPFGRSFGAERRR